MENRKILTQEEFYKEVGKYFKKRHHCDDNDVEIIMEDVKDPYFDYRCCWVMCEPDDGIEIDGRYWKGERHWFDFTRFQTFDNKHPFEYMVYCDIDDEVHTVDENVEAEKRYEILKK